MFNSIWITLVDYNDFFHHLIIVDEKTRYGYEQINLPKPLCKKLNKIDSPYYKSLILFVRFNSIDTHHKIGVKYYIWCHLNHIQILLLSCGFDLVVILNFFQTPI